MNMIIIEDDDNKIYQLESYIHKSLPETRVVIAKSFQSGLREIITRDYDLILLDMTMPTFDIDVNINEDGGRTHPLAGRELIHQMDRRDINIPVIIVTQFSSFGIGKDELTLRELDLQLQEEHEKYYKGYVFYSTTHEGWKKSLLKLIKKVIRDREQKGNV